MMRSGGVQVAPRRRGFSLVELMIVVAVIGILAAVAYPSYVRYVARGHRADLKVQLSSAQQWMERMYSTSYHYGHNAAGTAVDGVGGLFSQQAFSQSPPGSGSNARYTLDVSVDPDGQGYTIRATRVTAGVMAGDECGDATVTNTGEKGVVAATFASRFADAAAAVAECWQ